MLHQRLRVVVEALWKMQLPLQDVLVDHQRVVVGEGVDARNHLVDQHSQSPPVHGLAVSLVLQNFWSEILWGSTKGESSIFYGFGEAEIREFEVAVGANEDVFGLEVAVDDVAGVEVLEDENDVGGVEAGWGGKYAALWGSNMPSSRRWVKSSPPGTYSMNM